jgi:hypothetical protein
MPAAVAAAAVAAASGGALLLCLLLNCCTQSASDAEREREEDEASPLLSGSGPGPGREAGSGSEEEEPWPDRAPLTCCEATAVAARTARRTWELTVGRWGLHGLAFGIKRHMKRQVSGIPPFALPPLSLVHSVSDSGCAMFSASSARVSFALLWYEIEHRSIA